MGGKERHLTNIETDLTNKIQCGIHTAKCTELRQLIIDVYKLANVLTESIYVADSHNRPALK